MRIGFLRYGTSKIKYDSTYKINVNIDLNFILNRLRYKEAISFA